MKKKSDHKKCLAAGPFISWIFYVLNLNIDEIIRRIRKMIFSVLAGRMKCEKKKDGKLDLNFERVRCFFLIVFFVVNSAGSLSYGMRMPYLQSGPTVGQINKIMTPEKFNDLLNLIDSDRFKISLRQDQLNFILEKAKPIFKILTRKRTKSENEKVALADLIEVFNILDPQFELNAKTIASGTKYMLVEAYVDETNSSEFIVYFAPNADLKEWSWGYIPDVRSRKIYEFPVTTRSGLMNLFSGEDELSYIVARTKALEEATAELIQLDSSMGDILKNDPLLALERTIYQLYILGLQGDSIVSERLRFELLFRFWSRQSKKLRAEALSSLFNIHKFIGDFIDPNFGSSDVEVMKQDTLRILNGGIARTFRRVKYSDRIQLNRQIDGHDFVKYDPMVPPQDFFAFKGPLKEQVYVLMIPNDKWKRREQLSEKFNRDAQSKDLNKLENFGYTLHMEGDRVVVGSLAVVYRGDIPTYSGNFPSVGDLNLTFQFRPERDQVAPMVFDGRHWGYFSIINQPEGLGGLIPINGPDSQEYTLAVNIVQLALRDVQTKIEGTHHFPLENVNVNPTAIDYRETLFQSRSCKIRVNQD